MRNEMSVLGDLKPQTKISIRDTKYGTDMGRWFLATLGIWLLSKNTRSIIKIFSEIWIIMCYFLILFVSVPASLNTFLIQKDISKRIKMIGPIVFYIATLTKYKLLIEHSNDISECMQHMNTDFRRIRCDEDRIHMLRYAKLGRIIAILSTISMYSANIFYRVILPLSSPVRIRSDNVTVRPLGTPIYDPFFTAYTFKSWIIIFTGQFFGGYVMYTITIVACNLASIFVLHACGQMKLVMTRLEDCVEGNKHVPSKVEDRLAEIVQLHVRSLRFVLRIEHILNKISFAEVGASTLIICLVGYDLITCIKSHESTVIIITYSIRIISFTFNIFILCYIGETLSQQEKEIGEVAYLIDWHKLSKSNAREIILISVMSRYPSSITAGKIIELSFTTFCSIVKTSLAYLNVLRAMTE